MDQKFRLDLEMSEEERSQKFLDETKWIRRRLEKVIQKENIWDNIPGWRYVNLQKVMSPDYKYYNKK